ncbi:FAD-binding oxidoreductase [Bradyrhizobium manausense]|uniref:D-2-hydroxyglutarate dehydrogenase YdiJ n=1 Tax=Bradyrhizobium manausense TaxID=989370 RepID=UPI001BA6A441|nr:FAD-binding and (Fe-S)-binding domain-containing protein [Bradyrhizobium manausense]MBR0687468.1 FAD-binding oxidoreductase [Bradyrhizobium manausense]
MLPRVSDMRAPARLHSELAAELRLRGFEGDLASAYADRIVSATDNSIYQLRPQLVVFPRGVDDLVRLARVAAESRFEYIVFAPRGGGTGTNGQSLTEGLVVDVSRHMNRILEINPAERWVRVQAGVVKDQLNAALAEHGLFFPPELSTSNRATIGGMISTDASGQGSCLYGKTRDHVLELTTVLLDGTVWTSRPLENDELKQVQRRADLVGAVHRLVDAIQREQEELIAAHFPKLNRCLTGYDLAHIRDDRGRFNLNSILCGSEGTLALIAEAKLNVVPIPKHSALVNVRYGSFDAALRDAQELIRFGAASIETVDSRVLGLAQDDVVWDQVQQYFPEDDGQRAMGVNLVEFVGDTELEIEKPVGRMTEALASAEAARDRRGFTVARGEAEVNAIWTMRKKSVGLLGNMQGDKRPIPFVEDTAVPPEHLADYIAEFRALLDARKLTYGMFGHVDAGVLHVRPAIDMKDPAQEQLIREITEEVVRLTRKYGGLLWGEHGKGVRSEFSPRFFGPLYPILQSIKAAFDPRNQLNPGKIAAPEGGQLLTIDGLTTRGQLDRTIPASVRGAYDEALHCNGNGACFSWDTDEAMCPSYKATRDRRHSPKGRASLIREWLRQLAALGVDPESEAAELRRGSGWRHLPARLRNSWAREPDFSHAVKEAMDGCLACKSCSGQCPIKVDVPSFRAKFLEVYHGRYLRPLRDHLVGSLEPMLPALGKIGWLYNLMIDSPPGRAMMRAIGLVHSPKFSDLSMRRELAARGVAIATPQDLAALSSTERARSVVLVQDAFTSFYESHVVLAVLDLMRAIGFKPFVAPFRANGKPLHVHGFLGAFTRTASRNAAMLRELAATGVELVGVDASMTLTYRSEYDMLTDAERPPPVLLVQEWLARHCDAIPKTSDAGSEYLLLPHCSERSLALSSLRDWQAAFAAAGASLRVLPSGCCGMAGTYGHEAEHRATSDQIYGMSWARHVAESAQSGRLLATGYSCRSQVKIMDGLRLLHPAEALLAWLRAAS